MYVTPNFKTKKAFKEALKKGEEIRVFSPGPFPAPKNGSCAVEGPHYPEPHRWYASVDVVNSRVVKIR